MKGTEPARVGRATRPWGVVLFVQAANAALVVFLLIVLVGEQGRRLPDAWLAWVAVALSAWLLLRSFVVICSAVCGQGPLLTVYAACVV